MSTFPADSAGMAMGTPASRLALQSPAEDWAAWSMLRGTNLTADQRKDRMQYYFTVN